MNATIEGAAQKLDAIVWLKIKFKDSKIIYSGGAALPRRCDL